MIHKDKNTIFTNEAIIGERFHISQTSSFLLIQIQRVYIRVYQKKSYSIKIFLPSLIDFEYMKNFDIKIIFIDFRLQENI